MQIKTYEEVPGFGKTGQTLRQFGEQQNEVNAQLQEALQAMAKQLEQALRRIAELEAEQERHIQRFGRCAAELDAMEKELNKLRLTSKLHDNTINRLVGASGSQTE